MQNSDNRKIVIPRKKELGNPFPCPSIKGRGNHSCGSYNEWGEKEFFLRARGTDQKKKKTKTKKVCSECLENKGRSLPAYRGEGGAIGREERGGVFRDEVKSKRKPRLDVVKGMRGRSGLSTMEEGEGVAQKKERTCVA